MEKEEDGFELNQDERESGNEARSTQSSLNPREPLTNDTPVTASHVMMMTRHDLITQQQQQQH